MDKEKWTDSFKEWMDINQVLLDEKLYDDRGFLYFGTSQRSSNCFSITLPGTGPLRITKENGVKLADAIYESEGIDLRAEVTRLKAENERMREYIRAVAGDLEEMLDEDRMPIYDENIMGENIMSMVGMLQDALSHESTDESEPTDA